MQERYLRQYPLIGEEGQKRLSQASVLVVGCGGVGCPALQYLVAAGVGTIYFIDPDKIEISNLQRQVLFNESNVGCKKVDIAYDVLKELNSNISLIPISEKLDEELSNKIVNKVDIVIDGSDNYETMYLINDACVKFGKRLISCSILRDMLQVASFDVSKSCYRCLFPEAPPEDLIPNCNEAGVLGCIVGVAGTIAANLCINAILNRTDINDSTLLVYDGLSFDIAKYKVYRDPNCPSCNNIVINSYSSDNIGIYLSDMKEMDVLLVDVRDDWERDIKKLDNDIHMPISRVDEANINDFNGKKVVFYCQGNSRSKKIAMLFRNKYEIEAFYLVGGVNQ